MMTGLMKRLLAQKPKRVLNAPTFDADWSVISFQGVGMFFRGLLAELIGAPPPPGLVEVEQSLTDDAWRHTKAGETYFRKDPLVGFSSGFLVRGVIYDMHSLLQSCHKPSLNSMASPPLLQAQPDFKVRDWTSLVRADMDSEPKRVRANITAAVKANDLIESLGLNLVPNLQERLQIGALPKGDQMKQQSSLQDLDKPVTSADTIRAKYLDKIRKKKVLADLRREQTEIGVPPSIKSTGSKRGWRVLPGVPAVVRYIEARGLAQGLVSRGEQEDVDSFMDQIGNYRFQHVSQLLSNGSFTKESLRDLLRGICTTWGLEARQIMVVIGDGAQSQAILEAGCDLGFFICKVKGTFSEKGTLPPLRAGDQDGADQEGIRDSQTRIAVESINLKKRRSGLRLWFQKLATGTLHIDHRSKFIAGGRTDPHFSVSDMIELKWVVEDLNGVSYRKSTMIRGFEEMVGRKGI